MGALIPNILKIALQVLAGIGIGKLADKVAPDKVPTYPAEGVHDPDFNVTKIAWLVATMVIGGVILKLIGKKLNIKILK